MYHKKKVPVKVATKAVAKKVESEESSSEEEEVQTKKAVTKATTKIVQKVESEEESSEEEPKKAITKTQPKKEEDAEEEEEVVVTKPQQTQNKPIQASTSNCTELFIRNLAWATDENSLEQFFSKYGTIYSKKNISRQNDTKTKRTWLHRIFNKRRSTSSIE